MRSAGVSWAAWFDQVANATPVEQIGLAIGLAGLVYCIAVTIRSLWGAE